MFEKHGCGAEMGLSGLAFEGKVRVDGCNLSWACRFVCWEHNEQISHSLKEFPSGN